MNRVFCPDKLIQQGPWVREHLPVIPRHLVEQRAFAMHHFVVRERQNEVFSVGVYHAERGDDVFTNSGSVVIRVSYQPIFTSWRNEAASQGAGYLRQAVDSSASLICRVFGLNSMIEFKETRPPGFQHRRIRLVPNRLLRARS